MIYTVERMADRDMYSFWDEYTKPNGKKSPMLCFVVHCDCLCPELTCLINAALDDNCTPRVEFEFLGTE